MKINRYHIHEHEEASTSRNVPLGLVFQVLSMAIIVTIVHPMRSPEVGLTLEWSQSVYFCLLGVGFTFVSSLCGKIKTTDNAFASLLTHRVVVDRHRIRICIVQ